MHAVAAPGGDTDLQFRFLSLARQYLMEGGPDRIGYTLPPLVFATLRLVQRVRKVGSMCVIFGMCLHTHAGWPALAPDRPTHHTRTQPQQPT